MTKKIDLHQRASYYYDLDKSLIAQTPLSNRSDSRLMLLNRNDKTIEHNHFFNLLNYINSDDVLVFNTARVFNARIYGKKKDTLADIEFLLIEPINKNEWLAFAKPVKRLKKNTIIYLKNNLYVKVIDKLDEGQVIIVFFQNENILNNFEMLNILNEIGTIPLPPYIRQALKDPERYQTVYSRRLNSSAAPTAGLHFSKEMLKEINSKKIETLEVELAVGPGTFKPVKADKIKEHNMHKEAYKIDELTAEKLNKFINKKRIIAVGTTVVRVLENNFRKYGCFKAEETNTDLFVYPPQKILSIDAMITNFHLPESTLLMMVAAFAGYEFIMQAYKNAVKEKYRFFSFGDCMFIQ